MHNTIALNQEKIVTKPKQEMEENENETYKDYSNNFLNNRKHFETEQNSKSKNRKTSFNVENILNSKINDTNELNKSSQYIMNNTNLLNPFFLQQQFLHHLQLIQQQQQDQQQQLQQVGFLPQSSTLPFPSLNSHNLGIFAAAASSIQSQLNKNYNINNQNLGTDKDSDDYDH